MYVYVCVCVSVGVCVCVCVCIYINQYLPPYIVFIVSAESAKPALDSDCLSNNLRKTFFKGFHLSHSFYFTL